MLNFDKKLCIGCTACATICPKDAIQMVASSEGFQISTIDNDKCISCGRCEKVCPVLNETPTQYAFEEFFFCFCQSESDRMAAASGGVFGELAKATLAEGGLVCGCVWDENFKAEHIIAESIEYINRMKGSKYVQSNLGNVFGTIKKEVRNRKVLFVGTPCQTTALHRLVGETENLYLCALVCGGNPSPLVWQKYLKAKEDATKDKIISIANRSKKNGWMTQTMAVKYRSGQQEYIPLTLDSFHRSFYSKICTGKFCEECSFKWNQMSADIVIADGFGASKTILRASRNKGVSSVAILSKQGQELWSHVEGHMRSYPCSKERFMAHHTVIFQKAEKKPQRESFFANLNSSDIMDNLKKNVPARPNMNIHLFLQRIGLFSFINNWRTYLRTH